MKEHPILFSGEMVRAILDGRKTMTRRVVKPQPADGAYPHHGEADGVAFANPCSFHKYRFLPGDRLWVRETYNVEINLSNREKAVCYRADEDVPFGWKPSIFMPRWASRITLEITNIRVEQLRTITVTDAIKEGLDDVVSVLNFEKLWDSINGKKYPWVSNPWVWVIEFKRIK